MVEQWQRARPDLDVSPVEVIGRISRISRFFERSIEKSLQPFGITSGGYYVLAALRRSRAPYQMSPTQLHDSLLLSGGAMTHRLDILESAGLIFRLHDATDGRRRIVALSEAGRTLIDRVIEAHNFNEHALLASLDRDERNQLAVLLRRLVVAAGDGAEAAETAEATSDMRRRGS